MVMVVDSLLVFILAKTMVSRLSWAWLKAATFSPL